VAIVCHGLNLTPHKMHAICQLLHQQHIETVNVHLFGHGQRFPFYHPNWTEAECRKEAMRNVTASDWLQDYAQAFEIAHTRATRLDVPLYGLGFSLGGLITTHTLITHDQAHFDKVLLLAPALATRWVAHLLIPFRPWPRMLLRSGSPPPYRANPGTSINAYRALFAIYDETHQLLQKRPEQANLPVTILMDQYDELIATRKLNEHIDRYALTNWTVKLFAERKRKWNKKKHLIVDQQALGPEGWEELQKAVRDCFGLNEQQNQLID
jgi:pimeloyl-ACP methyl ester carboxylesterase